MRWRNGLRVEGVEWGVEGLGMAAFTSVQGLGLRDDIGRRPACL